MFICLKSVLPSKIVFEKPQEIYYHDYLVRTSLNILNVFLIMSLYACGMCTYTDHHVDHSYHSIPGKINKYSTVSCKMRF